MQTETRLAELRADVGNSRILRGTVMALQLPGRPAFWQ